MRSTRIKIDRGEKNGHTHIVLKCGIRIRPDAGRRRFEIHRQAEEA